MVADLLDPDRRRELDEANRPSRSGCASSTRRRSGSRCSPGAGPGQPGAGADSATCRSRPSPGSAWSCPELAALRELIDWQFFFLAWELKGKYPAILDQPAARELFDDANALLDEIIAGGLLQARGGVRVLACAAEGDDIVVGEPEAGCRCCASRRSSPTAGRTGAWPTTWPRPVITWAGSRWPSTAPRSWPGRYEASRDDYTSIMVKALADRLAEAFAEHSHLAARRDWFEPDARPSIEDLHAERFRGIRPAFGYPACPDHSGKPSCSTCSTPASSASP